MKYAILIKLERSAQMYNMHQWRKGKIVCNYVKGKQTPSPKHCIFFTISCQKYYSAAHFR